MLFRAHASFAVFFGCCLTVAYAQQPAAAAVEPAAQAAEQSATTGAPSPAPAPAGVPRTRAEAIELDRLEKSKHLQPDVPPKPERIIRTVQNRVLEPLFGGRKGWRLALGGLYPRSGFAFGPEYYRPDLFDGRVQFRSSARISLRRYEKLDAEVRFPYLAGGRLFLNLLGEYRNYPSIDYYGPGPDSVRTGRSAYRLEELNTNFRAGFRPIRFLSMGVTGGYLKVNVGRGRDKRFASTDATYTEAQAPGIEHQSDYLLGGPFAAFDYRDRPDDPHSGGFYGAEYLYFNDVKLERFDFRRLNVNLEQYIPFFNQKRVIALRGRTELSYRNRGVPVPFYLQPRLGGSNDLRGFRVFRFYDDNSLLLQGEYRWEVMTGFDMALFVDAGKVFPTKAQLNFTKMRTDAGFGLRFSSRDSVFMRWDVGFSQEGFQVWIKFGGGLL